MRRLLMVTMTLDNNID